MIDIRIYELDRERIDDICDDYDLTPAEVVEILLDNAEGSEELIFAQRSE